MPAVKTVDLCATHAEALAKLRERSSSKPKLKVAWNKADYSAINPRIVELADARPIFTAADVCKSLKIKPHIAKVAITQLIKARQLEVSGTGRGRKLSKAS